MDALIVNGLQKEYKNGKKALKQIDIKVKDGSFFALIGQNGAGKSTLIGILSHLIRKTSGHILLYGIDLEKNPTLFKSMLGVVPQEYNLSAFDKIETILHTQGGLYGLPRKVCKERAESLLKKMQLWEYRNEISRNLSGGMKRRLMIARALMHNPKLLILDEPTAGIDIEIRKSVWQLLEELNKLGTTIILTTHYLEEAEALCQDMAIIHDGKIIQSGTLEESILELSTKRYVLRLISDIAEKQLPSSHSSCQYTYIDSSRLEISVSKPYNLSNVFAELYEKEIYVQSIKSKNNDLEEVFFNQIQDY